jgi:MFS family permease
MKPGRISRFPLLRALRYRNYRLFFLGQGFSLIGTWVQQVAMSWLVYRLTGSAFLLGVVGFTSQIPSLVLSPFAGVLADRCNRRTLLFFTQALSMLQAVVLAVIVLAGSVQVWHIIVLSLFLGSVNAIDMPPRHSFVIDLVEDREDLGNAIALNSSIFNGARLVGPSLAGLLIATVGEGLCFLINALSYVAVIFALWAMRLKPVTIEPAKGSVLGGVRDGFVYAFRSPAIRDVLLLVMLTSFAGMPYTVLLPVFAKEILGGGANTFGFLMTASGVGAFSATIYLASRPTSEGLVTGLRRSITLFGLALIGFALSRTMWLSLVTLFLVGFGVINQLASSNTHLQSVVAEDKRGRVASFYALALMGVAPLGSLLSGAMASRIGVPATLILGSVACLAGSVLFGRRLGKMKDIEYWRQDPAVGRRKPGDP